MHPAVALGALELDALTELVNLGVSRAAGNLRTMVGAEVLLSVPSVEIVTHAQAAQIIGDREPEKLVAVHQMFEGDLSGRALLIFPEANSLELVRAVTGGALPLEDIIDLEAEALAETGNIILNGCLATIANMLQRTLHISLPEILHGSGVEIFGLSAAPSVASSAAPSEGAVLFLYINFSVKYRNIKGYIAVLMDMPSLTILKTLIGSLIQRAGDAHGNHATS
jgi:chemotaxis protein CheC